jgi:hypothetical protein
MGEGARRVRQYDACSQLRRSVGKRSLPFAGSFVDDASDAPCGVDRGVGSGLGFSVASPAPPKFIEYLEPFLFSLGRFLLSEACTSLTR